MSKPEQNRGLYQREHQKTSKKHILLCVRSILSFLGSPDFVHAIESAADELLEVEFCPPGA
jgi:hypothetical protein